jgi:AGCS family alanine or glycine:cation symporter
MTTYDLFAYLNDRILLIPFLFVLLGSIVLTWKTRFIQIRAIPLMFKLLFQRQETSKDEHTIKARRALFTAMSTSIGIANIVAPIIAIGFGGPGALLGFMLATIFGGAATFAEATFAVSYRKRFPSGHVIGGPMQYLKEALHPIFSYVYAGAAVLLLVGWSSNQSNQLAVLLETWSFPRPFVGFIIAIFIIALLIAGIKTIGSLVEKLVPLMFIFYASAMSWILLVNIHKIPAAIWLVFSSAFSIEAVAGGAFGVGLQRALRWGLAKALQSNEAGIGTMGIAHSVAETKSPFNQGILSMVAVYTNGFLCLLSGMVVLVTGVWLDSTLSFDIMMIDRAMSLYFPGFGPIVLTICAFLFSLTTILGNSYFGTQCYRFTTNNRWVYLHYLLVGVVIFFGAVSDVRFIWSIVDFFMIPVAIPHIIGIVILAFKKKNLLKTDATTTDTTWE